MSLTDYYAGLDGDLFGVDSVHHSGSEDNAITRLEPMRPAAYEYEWESRCVRRKSAPAILDTKEMYRPNDTASAM